MEKSEESNEDRYYKRQKNIIINKYKNINKKNIIDIISYALFLFSYEEKYNNLELKNIIIKLIYDLVNNIIDKNDKKECLYICDNLMKSIINNILKYGNHKYYIKNNYKDCCCFGFTCFKY